MTDSEALDLAWKTFREREPDTFRTGTDEDKRFAAYSLQIDNLQLSPLQSPPCLLTGDDDVDPVDLDAEKILRKMLDAGISPWHPDPLAVLVAQKKLRRKVST